MRIDDLDTPALLVNLDLMEANIAALFAQLRPSGVRVRPHLKTAKCPEVARILAAAGARGFCVAKLGEAEVMAAAGIDDLLITSEIAGAPKLRRLAALHAAHPQVRVVVDSVVGARLLDDAVAGSPTPLKVLIELDVGQGRCGAAPGEPARALARAIAGLPHLRLVGLQGYEGHLQHSADHRERDARVDAAMAQLTATADLLRADGHAIDQVTTGGTGTCERCASHPGVSEVQPGSFVFLDRAYRDALGPQGGYANALTVISTVISRPVAGRAVLDAGLKALPTDMGNAEPVGLPGVSYCPGGDEHGILTWANDADPGLAIGDRVALIPGHIDTTVNLFDVYHAQRGGEVVAIWPIAARGRSQ
ncbi:DSD1 family PLP-dependent enzyme [Chloroflexales bacterium ZM16-3]|nr:DSD1 family PLP-dependent enzyme [Chloroflexales bacterium ZM16-3]